MIGKDKHNAEDFLNIKDVENKLITVALAKSGGNRATAAELLGISERSLKRKIAQRRGEKEDDCLCR